MNEPKLSRLSRRWLGLVEIGRVVCLGPNCSQRSGLGFG